MICISTDACFQIMFIFSLYVMLLYTCNRIVVNKSTKMGKDQESILLLICADSPVRSAVLLSLLEFLFIFRNCRFAQSFSLI